MNDDSRALSDFGGIARLFPLPNLVLYPNLLQPLHIFEPRYRQMMADALDGDRLIAMVLLRPGFEPDYEGTPAIYSVACLGKILSEQHLPDGRFNLQLHGLSRIRIVKEIETGKLYRSARVDLLPEVNISTPDEDAKLRDQLQRIVSIWNAKRPQGREMFDRLFQSDLPLGTISDVLAFALPLPMEFKQDLLETTEVSRRIRRLTDFLEEKMPADEKSGLHSFPPNFSPN